MAYTYMGRGGSMLVTTHTKLTPQMQARIVADAIMAHPDWKRICDQKELMDDLEARGIMPRLPAPVQTRKPWKWEAVVYSLVVGCAFGYFFVQVMDWVWRAQ